MAINITDFKHRCLEIIREIERTGKTVAITRRGKVVAQVQPPVAADLGDRRHPWERLRGSAECRFEADESVLKSDDFAALR